ncbi:S41 family peptidase [Flavobacteriaceae bacterium]|nr:S41 family peptidase [Flavobacteriaceae bacterium]
MNRQQAEKKLKKIFGFDMFYEEQWKTINLLFQGKRVLLIEKTGFGKSLCFQFPATQLKGLTIIFSPLIALMRDQVKGLKANNGINAKYINSEQTREENSQTIQKQFTNEVDGNFYQAETSTDHKVRTPKPNAFHGNVFLLISPRVASAGSLFAAMVAGNINTSVIGEETMGGYYGHNGHSELGYILPKSKIEVFFSVVNLSQDVPKKGNQIHNRGIIPDIIVSQSFEDFLEHKDTQMNFVLDLIKKIIKNRIISPNSISFPNLAVQFRRNIHETRKQNNIRCRLRSRYWECHWRTNR